MRRNTERESMTFDESYIRKVLEPKIKEDWIKEKTYLPEFLPCFGEGERRENEKRISESLGRFRGRMNGFSYRPGRKKRWKQDMEKLLHEILWTEPLLGIESALPRESLAAFEREMKVFVRRSRRFDPGLGLSDLGQALRNYMVYAIFCEMNGVSQKCTSAIFGYSMMYPYSDNYTDAPGRTREELLHYYKLMADKIRGGSFGAVSEHDWKTVELLEAVEQSYVRPNDLYEGLLLILDAQKESQRQSGQDDPLTEDEVFAVTVYKGGISVLIDRYFMDKPLTEKDYEFYYGFGFLLQLCDDLQDMASDRACGSSTVFTMCRTGEEVAGNVNRLIHYMKKLFASCDCVREGFRDFLLRQCSLLILISAARSREYMTEEWLAWLEERLPVSADFLAEVTEGFTPGLLEKGNKRYMKMIDVLVG